MTPKNGRADINLPLRQTKSNSADFIRAFLKSDYNSFHGWYAVDSFVGLYFGSRRKKMLMIERSKFRLSKLYNFCRPPMLLCPVLEPG